MTFRGRWSDTLFNVKPERFSTTPLQGLVHDKLTNTLNHDLMNPPSTEDRNTTLCKAAEEILSSMILSARCQNNRQLLLRWLMQSRRKRSHFRRCLQARVREVVDATVRGDREKDETERKDALKHSKEMLRRTACKRAP